MPSGMALKSEGFASDLSSDADYTLKRFCTEHALDYADIGQPVSRQTFVDYGLAFQQRLVPDIDGRTVDKIAMVDDGFTIHLADGVTVRADRVVMAIGLSYYKRIPDSLAQLPAGYVSHSSDHSDLSRFQGRRVVVVGGGASALDLAALLNEQGAQVCLIARRKRLIWLSKSVRRTWWRRLLRPQTCIGFGLHHYAYMAAPSLFRYLPKTARHVIARRALGQAGGFDVKDRVVGRLPILLDHSVYASEIRDECVVLKVAAGGGAEHVVRADHVIAATGFQVDIRRLCLLSDELRAQLLLGGRVPELSRNFESSVRGLYFAGASAAFSFGPLLRFVAGTRFAAPCIANHLHRVTPRKPNPDSRHLAVPDCKFASTG